ncbi:glycosyltransferase family 2 protein [Arthrobacter sp.]|uniref:glycosyltransferase family 2 protein n=1 Tax=Arthrobacter sp. TaxID=1667 RepID=UPI003A94B2A5
MKPSVSVIIPTYNSVELLDVALNSVWHQTLDQREIEVIVIDDGSTDSTWKFLKSLAEKHSNVLPLHQANAGRPSVGRNRGMDEATGEFVFFLDSDDWLGPKALELLVAAARAHGSDVVLGRQRGENRTVSTSAFLETIYDADLLEDGLWDVLSPCRLFRRSLIESVGARFPEDMVQGEDQVFVALCCFSAKKISVLADYDYYFVRGRTDGENLSRRVQSFENKFMTTTRMAALIVQNTEPGRIRERYFHRVLYRTLAPGLGIPFMAASEADRDKYLVGIQQQVLAHMAGGDLADARDVPRLRLAVAQLGDARDLAALNESVATGLVSQWDEGQLMLDLGPELNGLVGHDLRIRRNELRAMPAAVKFERTERHLMIRVSHSHRTLNGSPYRPELVMKARNASQQKTFQASSWNGPTETTFDVPLSEFVAPNSSGNAIWDPRLSLRARNQLLDLGRVALSDDFTADDLKRESVANQFTLYRSQQGNLSIRILQQSANHSTTETGAGATSTPSTETGTSVTIGGRLRQKAMAVLTRLRR